MDDRATAPNDLPRLLKRLYRFRRRSRRRDIGRLFLRYRKAALIGALARAWRGDYIMTDAGELACVPAPLDARGERLMFHGFAAPRPALAFLPPGGTAIDVGANLGEWSVPLARTVGCDGRVLCVEPNPAVAAALEATLRINNLAQAEMLPVALAAEDGEGRLLVERNDTGRSRLSSDAGTVPVPLRRLDGIVAERQLKRLDLLKIDVEGQERFVLVGATETLGRLRPAVIFESGHETPEDRQAIAALFSELAYDVVAVLHDYGALACEAGDYVGARGPCAGTEARNILALPRSFRR